MEEDLRHNKQRLACPFYNASLQGDSTCSEKCIVSFKDLAHVQYDTPYRFLTSLLGSLSADLTIHC